MHNALITGGAGFIGSHLVERLLLSNWQVSVVDNFDDFYPRKFKTENIKEHKKNKNWQLIEGDIRDFDFLLKSFQGKKIDVVFHLAAKAGVRPSIVNPFLYQEVNVQGTQNLLELTRLCECKQFIFASSSSVYGVNTNIPWQEKDQVLLPISPYAATKVSSELLGHVYSYLYGIRFLALRFFTVYGPRQRPDLAISKFLTSLIEGKEIHMFGEGGSKRDYTYVSDVVDALIASVEYKKTNFEIINVGNNKPISLIDLVSKIEKVTGVKAKIKKMANQAGDVPITYADISKAQKLIAYSPKVTMTDGLIKQFEWLKNFNIKK